MLVDTWKVCGDNTPRHINNGDGLRIYAERELFSYDAWRITSEDGVAICNSASQARSTDQPERDISNDKYASTDTADATPGNDGVFSETVRQVWEDGFRLELDAGRTIRVDSWDVCGDNTRSHINTGDQIRVTVQRSGVEYDASRIVDESGRALCEGAAPPAKWH